MGFVRSLAMPHKKKRLVIKTKENNNSFGINGLLVFIIPAMNGCADVLM